MKRIWRNYSAALCGMGAVALLGTPAQAQDSVRVNRFLSGTGNILFLGAGVARPLLLGKDGKNDSLRIADSVLTSVALTQGIKLLVREKRPDESGDRDSFPSGHATAAFAVATMQAHYHPKEAPYWYLGAALIAESRVGLHRHYVHDVLVGAAIGYFTARFALSRRRGLLLSPVIGPESGQREIVLSFTY